MIIQELHKIANKNGLRFGYGTKGALNLFDEQLADREQVCWILSPMKFEPIISGGSIERTTKVSLTMLLLTSSQIEDNIYKENLYKDGKYIKNIYPMFETIKKMTEQIQCLYGITTLSYKEIYDEMDFNLDGLWIDLTLEVE